MAKVLVHFGPTASGAGDGSSPANRAAMYSSGNWNSLLSGISFAGSDSYEFRIQPGNYTSSQQLVAGLFASAPGVTNRLWLTGCFTNGDPIPTTDGWSSDSGDLPTTDMPLITVTAQRFVSLPRVNVQGLRIVSSVANETALFDVDSVNWCSIEITASTGANAIGRCSMISNSSVFMNSSNYGAAIFQDQNVMQTVANCRLRGLSGTSGNRRGVNVSAFAPSIVLTGSTLFGFGGKGVYLSGNSATHLIRNSVIAGVGGDGIEIVQNTTGGRILMNRCAIVGCGGYGVRVTTNPALLLSNSRFRNNTSGDISESANFANFDLYTTAASDAADFVDAANGNYRIKSTAGFAGRGIGVSEEASGGGPSTRWGPVRELR